jgi:hypothetical protein
VLPRYIVHRPKQGFCPPIGDWCEQLLARRGVPDESPLFESGILSKRGVEEVRQRAGNGFAVWTIDMLLDWVSRNVEVSSVLSIEEAMV